MAYNNSSTKNNQLNKPQRTSSNVHFNDVSKKSPKQDWRYKGNKCKHNTFAQEQEHNNATAWQIDSLKRILAKIEKDPKGVLSMILDIWSIYTKYLNKANKADKERNEIRTCTLELEQELYISNEERKQAVSFL